MFGPHRREAVNVLLFNPATDALDPNLGFAVGWIEALAKRASRIDVVTMRRGDAAWLPGNVRVHSLGKEKGFGEPRRLIEFYRLLFPILRDGEIDVCFSHMIPLFVVLAAPILKARSVPIVMWHAHRDSPPLLRIAHGAADRVVSTSMSSYGWRKDKLTCIGQGIDAELFRPGVPDKAGGLPEDARLLVSVGRLSPIKDQMTLIRAVHLLRRRGLQFRCAFVGEAPERDRAYAEGLRRETARPGLEDAVQWVGATPHHETAGWMARAFVHVNLCPRGALDKAALEAMACGKPSLTANDGFSETLGPWAEDLLFRHGDPHDLAMKIERLSRWEDARMQAMTSDLRRSVLERHSLEGLADRLTAVLREAAEGRRG
jgi:glycosyltransferase involved in cell wall biosynthesis